MYNIRVYALLLKYHHLTHPGVDVFLHVRRKAQLRQRIELGKGVFIARKPQCH